MAAELIDYKVLKLTTFRTSGSVTAPSGYLSAVEYQTKLASEIYTNKDIDIE